MRPLEKGNAERAPGEFQIQSNNTTAKRINGRPEFQGKSGNARNRSRHQPRWTSAPSEEALAALEALWGPPSRPIPRRRP
jgi:hypothetical protein